MHSKGLRRTDSEEFSAHLEPSRTPAAHARGRPTSSSLLCELLDRILAVVRFGQGTGLLTRTPPPQANAYAIIQRRAQAVGIRTRIGNHTFRATSITAYLRNG